MNIGLRIKRLRESCGLTLEQVGDYIGVKKTTIQRYETEEIDIKRTTAIKLATILNTNPSYIMGWTDCQDPDGEMHTKETDPLRSTLLHNFDQLNQEGRTRLVETSDDMVSSGKYIKADATEPPSKGKLA